MVTQEPNTNQKAFFTQERLSQEQAQRMESPRGRLLIAGCSSGSYLSMKVVVNSVCQVLFLRKNPVPNSLSFLPQRHKGTKVIGLLF